MRTEGKKSIIFIVLFGLSAILGTVSCNHNYSPKPRGYFRIDLPEKKYQVFKSACPYQFEFPEYATITDSKMSHNEPCWKDIIFEHFNAKIHLSYKTVENNLPGLLEDSRTFVYKHTIKADAIDEKIYVNQENSVYGILYHIRGNVASTVQFFMTDSTDHFLRGALYFNTQPNKDSLAPVVDFLSQDITHLVETLQWK